MNSLKLVPTVAEMFIYGNDINDYTNCHSERQRRIFIVKMLHFVQHDSEWMISEVQTDISLPKIIIIFEG